MSSLQFQGKAGTLRELAKKQLPASILPLHSIRRETWVQEREKTLAQLRIAIPDQRLIVRSSAASEDERGRSLAGAYLSVLDVRPADLGEAIDRVFASYSTAGVTDGPDADDAVFVQRFLAETSCAGVCFTRDLASGAPYWVINYDSVSGRTDTVTAGTSATPQVYYCQKSPEALQSAARKSVDPRLLQVIELARSLETVFASDRIDFEFAFASNAQPGGTPSTETLYLLQARALPAETAPAPDAKTHAALKIAQGRLEQHLQAHPFLHGRHGILGNMPDWNPAEIIGTHPRPLALSLYKEIITDSIWAYQRDNYGYLNLRSFPLLHDVCGHPYVDVRVSFNSFVPKSLDPALAGRLVEAYLARLRATPALHDKIEFEIVLSCYFFDLDSRLKEYDGFSESDRQAISRSLRELTTGVLNPLTGLWHQDARKVLKLAPRREEILGSRVDGLDRVYWLIEDCKRYGTLPFAGLARAAFIAVQMIRSLERLGALSPEESSKFFTSLETPASLCEDDLVNLSRQEYLLKYGHLRPGTYDITSQRYDQAPDLYFDWSAVERRKSEPPSKARAFKLAAPARSAIGALLKEHGFSISADELFEFFRGAIEGRENSKFEFTKNLSLALNEIALIGRSYGLSVEECSYLDYSTIYRLHSSSRDREQAIRASIEEGKAQHAITRSTLLPSLIGEADDIWSFHNLEAEPNFITSQVVTGPVASIHQPREALRGAIVVIESADPGYDWLFSAGIAGFVTMYGGANSHMAIRAAELNIPAVIGCGESLFRKWATSSRLEIDCSNRRVQTL